MALSDVYKKMLAEMAPHFEENLRWAFQNDMDRLQRKRDSDLYVRKLDDVLVSHNTDTKIELCNMKFRCVPDLNIVQMGVDLTELCLNINLDLGSFKIKGEYEANNLTLQKLLPVSHIGKILIIFNDVKVEGRVGLLIREDSLMPENYDIKYTSGDVSVMVKYYVDEEIKIENKITNSNIDASLGGTIWIQLTELISDLLHDQLCNNFVEFSLTETLADCDTDLRVYTRAQNSKANLVVDSLSSVAKNYLTSKNLCTVKIPSFNVTYRCKLSDAHQYELTTGEGYVRDLSTLTRQEDFSLFEDDKKIVIYGNVHLELEYGYDNFTTEYEGTKINGVINAAVSDNTFFLKVVVIKGKEKCVTADLQVKNVKDKTVDVSGSDLPTWLISKLNSWVKGNLRQEVLSVVQKHLEEVFQYAVTQFDCVKSLTI